LRSLDACLCQAGIVELRHQPCRTPRGRQCARQTSNRDALYLSYLHELTLLRSRLSRLRLR
jgi:hypothetical protein